jgi:hypothetical protein
MIHPKMFVPRSPAGIAGPVFAAGNIFTACRIRNTHTAQFETQRE